LKESYYHLLHYKCNNDDDNNNKNNNKNVCTAAQSCSAVLFGLTCKAKISTDLLTNYMEKSLPLEAYS
jgi:hypothetical protein